jgi:hypothetical protein
MPYASRVVLLAKTRQTFFQHPVLERELGHHLLELAVLGAEFFDLIAGGLADGIPRELFFASFEKVLAPAVIQVGRDAFPPAQLRDALLTPQTFENDPDLLLGCELPASASADLSHRCFSGLLLLRHIETLLGASTP